MWKYAVAFLILFDVLVAFGFVTDSRVHSPPADYGSAQVAPAVGQRFRDPISTRALNRRIGYGELPTPETPEDRTGLPAM